MKTKKIITTFLIILSIFIIYKFLQVNYFTNKKEGFTSGFRNFYRSHLRNVRLFGSEYYNRIKNSWRIFFRKFGLI